MWQVLGFLRDLYSFQAADYTSLESLAQSVQVAVSTAALHCSLLCRLWPGPGWTPSSGNWAVHSRQSYRLSVIHRAAPQSVLVVATPGNQGYSVREAQTSLGAAAALQSGQPV